MDWSLFAYLGSAGLLQAEKGNVLARVDLVLMTGVHMDRSHISVLLYVLRRTMGETMVRVFVFARVGTIVYCPWSFLRIASCLSWSWLLLLLL